MGLVENFRVLVEVASPRSDLGFQFGQAGYEGHSQTMPQNLRVGSANKFYQPKRRLIRRGS